MAMAHCTSSALTGTDDYIEDLTKVVSIGGSIDDRTYTVIYISILGTIIKPVELLFVSIAANGSTRSIEGGKLFPSFKL